jgi:hypothetical protein
MRCAIGAAVAFLLLAGCTSTWDRQTQVVKERVAASDWEGAAQAQNWLVQNAYTDAPKAELGPRFEAARLLDLGDYLARSGQTIAAVETYREVLRVDPSQIEAVLVGVGMLEIPEDKRNALMDEFVQNVVVIDQRVLLGISPAEQRCWSYVAHEIRVRRQDRSTGLQGFEHHIVYDARPWVFDVQRQTWRADGEWINDAGSEVQRVNGPPNARYRAVLDADGGYYVDGTIPSCHADFWIGPYDPGRGTTYVARRLPGF